MQRFFNEAAVIASRDMSIQQLMNLTSRQNDHYMKMLDKKTALEKTFQDESIDREARCEAYQELRQMIVPMQRISKILEHNLQELQARQKETLTDEQRENLNLKRMEQ